MFFIVLNELKEISGIKKVVEKVYECFSNLYSLKVLYNYVVNRGEYIKEIIKNIVIKGKFWFSLKEKDCDVFVGYK